MPEVLLPGASWADEEDDIERREERSVDPTNTLPVRTYAAAMTHAHEAEELQKAKEDEIKAKEEAARKSHKNDPTTYTKLL